MKRIIKLIIMLLIIIIIIKIRNTSVIIKRKGDLIIALIFDILVS